MEVEKPKRKIKKWVDRKTCVKVNVQKALDDNDMDALEAAMPRLQWQFANEYIKDFNGSQAVLRTDSECLKPEQMAYQWLNNPGVKAVVEHLLQERTARMKIDQGYVIQKLIRTIEQAEKENNHQAVLRGAELLAKHLGMFVDKIEHTGKDGESIKYEEIQNEAAEFTRSITQIAKRSNLKVVGND